MGERQGIAHNGVRAIETEEGQLQMVKVLQKLSVCAPSLSTDQCEHPLV